MIKLDISTALAIYLFITAVLLLLMWSFFYDFGTRLKNYSSDEKFIWHCAICSYTFIDSMNDDMAVCPRCGTYIQRARRSFRPGVAKRAVSGGRKNRKGKRR